MSTSFTVNGKSETVDVDPSKPLLWVIREQLALTGTKFGCGIAQCGACTVHIDGQAVRSCVTPFPQSKAKKSPRSKGLLRLMVNCIRYSKLGLTIKCRNVATVNQDK